jgi:hypothetical protein
LDAIAEAHRFMKSNRQMGKIVVKVWNERQNETGKLNKERNSLQGKMAGGRLIGILG